MGKYGRARDGPDCAKRVARTAALVPGRRRRFAKAPPLGFAVSQHAPDALPSGRLCDARAGATVPQRPGSPLRRGVFRRPRFRAGAVRALKRARVPRRGGAAGAGSPPEAYVRRGVSGGARERATRPRRELPRRAKPAAFSCKTGTGPAWGGWTIPGAPARRTRRLFRGGRAGVVQKTTAGRSLRLPVARPARGGGRRPSGTGRRRKAPNAKDAGGGRPPPIRGRERSSRRGGWGAGKPGRGADPASRRPADCPAETPYASGRRHAGVPGRAKNAAEFVAFVRFAAAAGSGRVPEPAPDCADNPNRIKRAAKSGRALIGGADPQRCARVPRRPGFALELARSFILNRRNISMSGYGANVRLCGRNVAPELMTWP